MDKGTKKKADQPQYDADAIGALVKMFGYSDYYIRQCINGNKVGVMPDKVKKQYPIICQEMETAKQKVIEKFTNN